MAKTKIEKIASIEEEIKQLKERQKLLQQQHNAQERKDRTKRLCRRMGLFESLLPDTITLTDDLFKTFLENTILSEYARKHLSELTAQNAAAAVADPRKRGGAVCYHSHRQTRRNGAGERRRRGRGRGNSARVNG